MQQASWNEPKQARSRRSFEHMLEIAAQLFASHGYETVTTNHIAAEAGVSIGALYRFFPNKEAILHALVQRYQQRLWQLFPGQYDLRRDYGEVLGELVGGLMAFDAAEAAFQQIFVTVEAETALQMQRELVAQVKMLIAAYHPQLGEADLTICAEVGVAIVRGMMPLARDPHGMPRAQLAGEMRRALLAYLQAYLAANRAR